MKTPSKNAWNWTVFLGGIPKILFKKMWGFIGQKKSTFWSSRKLKYEKIICFWNDSLFFLYFLQSNGNGKEGSEAVKSEFFGSFRNHQKNILKMDKKRRLTTKNLRLGTQDFRKFWDFQILRFPKSIFSKDVPVFFLYFLK